MAENMITWTPNKLKRFKKAYNAYEEDTFMFDGNEFVKGYAKCLIEYLEGRLRSTRELDGEDRF